MSQPIWLLWIDLLNVIFLDFCLDKNDNENILFVVTSIWLVNQAFGYSVKHLISWPTAQN